MTTEALASPRKSFAEPMNAQAVLNRTRRELSEFLTREPGKAKSGYSGTTTNEAQPSQRNLASTALNARQRHGVSSGREHRGVDWIGLAKAGASTWWRGHPLKVGAAVVEPIVADYVRRKPVATLFFAAGVGAALVVLRPWRLASISALGASLVRSSNLPVMAASLVATVAENIQKDQS